MLGKEQAQGLEHDRQALYHGAVPPDLGVTLLTLKILYHWPTPIAFIEMSCVLSSSYS